MENLSFNRKIAQVPLTFFHPGLVTSYSYIYINEIATIYIYLYLRIYISIKHTLYISYRDKSFWNIQY